MLVNIQVLRLLGVLTVLSWHLRNVAIQGHLPFLYASGVDLFFVISGFIMTYTTGQRETTAAAFYRNRLIRVVPLYWLFTTLMFAVALALPHLLEHTRADWLALVKSLLFIPFRKIGDDQITPILVQGWSLNYEMFFYTVFALALLVRSRRVALAIVLVVLTACAAGRAARPSGTVLSFYTDSFAIEFGFGILVGIVYPALPERIEAGIATTLAAIATVCLSLLCITWGNSLVPPLCYGLPSAALLLSAVWLEKGGWRFDHRVTTFLGNASYAIYLSHLFLCIPAQFAAQRAHLGPLACAALIAVTGALSLAVGGAIHATIERPMTIFLNRKARRHQIVQPIMST